MIVSRVVLVAVASEGEKVFEFGSDLISARKFTLAVCERRARFVPLHITVVTLFQGPDKLSEFCVRRDLLVNVRHKLAISLAQLVGRKDESRRHGEVVECRDNSRRILGVGQVVRNQEDKARNREGLALQTILDEVKSLRGDLGGRFPDRQTVDEIRAVSTHGNTDRPGVRRWNGDGLNPGNSRHRELIDQPQNGLREGLPAKIWLKARQQQKWALKFIFDQVELQSNRTIVRDMVLVERDHGSPGTIVKQTVIIEGRDDLILEIVQQVAAQLADRRTRIRKPGETGDEGQALWYLMSRGQVVESAGRIHTINFMSNRRDDAPCAPQGHAESEHSFRMFRIGRWGVEHAGANGKVRSMTTPTLSLSPEPTDQLALVLFAARVDQGTITVHSSRTPPTLSDDLAAIGFRGGKDELVRLPGRGQGPAVAVIGLPGEVTADTVRYAAGSAIRQLAGVEAVTIDLDTSNDSELLAVLEGAALGAYAFRRYRGTGSPELPQPVQRIEVIGQASTTGTDIVARAVASAEAVALVKDLVNTPAGDLYPESFVEAAQDAVKGLPVTTRVWDVSALEHDGFGGIIGVGQGSTRAPRLMKIDYNPSGAQFHLALVGKGITFDSGGLSLKPATSMVGMKYDMTGAATVLAACQAIAQLGLTIHVTAWLCLAENMPSGSAIRPNDVLRIRGGSTVEVLNTDAEGRLVLADGLVAASEEHPDAIVDVATLTGAATIALGTRYAAVMGSEEIVPAALTAAQGAGELLWPMPLPGELRATLNSDVADIANANPGNTAGGMLLAGVFLREFVGRVSDAPDAPAIPWAHFDIAGAAKSPAAPYGFTAKGPTGVSVRTLIRLAEDISAK